MASAKALCLQSSRWKGQWDYLSGEKEEKVRAPAFSFPFFDAKEKPKEKNAFCLKKRNFRTFWHARQQYQVVLHLEQRSRLSVSLQFPGEREREEAREGKTVA